MGWGGYSLHSATHRTEARTTAPVQSVFLSRACHPSMDPRDLKKRESCDSDEHPDSVGIAFILDVTKSMGDVPEELARRTLPKFVSMILSLFPHMQILFGAIGDAQDGDRAPLQIGQFESSDALIDQWLTRIFIEQGGGDNRSRPSYESYDLALFFAARLVHMDCYEKRGRKGYLFLTGDECPRDRVSAQVVNRIFGYTLLERDVPLGQIIAEAAEKFHIFFLIPDQRRAEECESEWRHYLGDNVIVMEDAGKGVPSGADTAIVAATLIGLTEGGFATGYADVGGALEKKHGCDRAQASRIYRTVQAYAATRPDFEPNRSVTPIDPDSITRRQGGIVRLEP